MPEEKVNLCGDKHEAYDEIANEYVDLKCDDNEGHWDRHSAVLNGYRTSWA